MDNVLIKALSDGQFHSGQDLANLLGLSRTAIWKHLRKLESYGLPMETVRGQGYRIPGGIELLDQKTIMAALNPNASARITRMEVHDVISSTNDHIAGLAELGDGVVCLAERQSNGKGRRGRQWQSPYGRNIYLSMGRKFAGGASSLEGLSLAVGIAVRRALAGREQVLLKWPNDLLHDNRKLAGILIEMAGDPSGECRVVIGVGVNAGMKGELRPEIDQPWADASEVCTYTRNEIAARILNELIPIIDDFERNGFGGYVDEWREYDACKDKTVHLVMPTVRIAGLARGVWPNGALCLEVNGELQSFSGGEISLRVENDPRH